MFRVILCFTFILFSNNSFAQASLLDKMISLEKKGAAPAIQRVYLHNKLRYIAREYTKWLDKIDDNEFFEHLQISYFGGLLYNILAGSPDVEEGVSVRELYLDLIRNQFNLMAETIRAYSLSEEFDGQIYALINPFVKQYVEAFTLVTNGQKPLSYFQEEEQKITKTILTSALSNLSKEMIQTLIFLEFQALEYGLNSY